MIYPGEGKKGQPKAGDYVLAPERAALKELASRCDRCCELPDAQDRYPRRPTQMVKPTRGEKR